MSSLFYTSNAYFQQYKIQIIVWECQYEMYLFIYKVYRYIKLKTKFVKSLWIRFNWTKMLFVIEFPACFVLNYFYIKAYRNQNFMVT